MNAPDIKEQLATRAFAIQHSAAPETIRLLREAAIHIAELERQLSDPATVHINMLRGTIAKPTLEQIIHLYGVDALCKALSAVIMRGDGE